MARIDSNSAVGTEDFIMRGMDNAICLYSKDLVDLESGSSWKGAEQVGKAKFYSKI